jgi:hypothetical protein
MVDLPTYDFDEAPWIYLISVMLHPEDAQKRAEFLNVMAANGLKELLSKMAGEADAPKLRAGAAVWAIEYGGRWQALAAEACAPTARGAKGAAGPGHGGPLAGLTLLIPLIAWRKDPSRRPGRGAAYRVLAKLIGSGASERTLQTNWMKYRSVAHFWAAFELMEGFPKDWPELIDFLALANQLQYEAANYVPAREREPLLPPETSVYTSMTLRASPNWVAHVELGPTLLDATHN